MNTNTSFEVRRECLQPAIYYAEPTGAEIQETIRLADKTGRQIRKWASGEATIPYSEWALLCYAAGFGHIWEIQKPNGFGSQIARDTEN